jgi:hypothetical protein
MAGARWMGTFFAKATFAAVRISIVVNWPRLSSRRLDDVATGRDNCRRGK